MQKAISALRDDFGNILTGLGEILQKKKTLLKKFLLQETEIPYLTSRDDLSGVLESLQCQQDRIDEIDLTDFHLSAAADRASKVAGVTRGNFLNYLSSLNSETARQIIESYHEISELQRALSKKRDALIESMKSESVKLKKIIADLNRIIDLKDFLP